MKGDVLAVGIIRQILCDRGHHVKQAILLQQHYCHSGEMHRHRPYREDRPQFVRDPFFVVCHAVALAQKDFVTFSPNPPKDVLGDSP